MVALLIAYCAAFLFGFSYRYVLRKFASARFKKNAQPNIGKPDKTVRLLIAVMLLGYGVYTGSSMAYFFSGFSLFEAIFSWCGFYALIGRNTCPVA